MTATLAEELRTNHDAIIDTLLQRAQTDLQGTLYERMNQQKLLRARYTNVLDVITEYAADPVMSLFRQHHIIIFMQRYYVDIDETSPLTASMIAQRTTEIQRSVALYLDVLKQYTSAEQHARLEEIFVDVRHLITEMGSFLDRSLHKYRDRIPTVKMEGIDYAEESAFDIDPRTWPEE